LPEGALIRDAAGNLYGTASQGGITTTTDCLDLGCGVVYRLNAAGQQTVLYRFTGTADGIQPMAGVIRDAAGNLYGTTAGGGSSQRGTVYKLDPAGHHAVLYSFSGGADGGNPQSRVIRDAAGNLHGTAMNGGVTNESICDGSGCGVIFKIDPSGHETVLYTFTGGSDGGLPQAGLIADLAGNLYGTTSEGGYVSPPSPCPISPCPNGSGVLFRLDPTRQLTILHTFNGVTEGQFPSGVVRDAAGNLYGTAEVNTSRGNTGHVFRVSPAGDFTVLYTFYVRNFFDGAYPQAGVIRDAAGNLYATAYGGLATGGPGSTACGRGCGVVLKLDSAGRQTVLYRFPVEPQAPVGGLIRDSSGNLLGTTVSGGTGGLGAVFKLDATGRVTVLHSFGGSNGAMPMGTLASDSAGNLYGTTYEGGLGPGTVFKLDSDGQDVWVSSFPQGGIGGGFPASGLVLDPEGNLYGTAYGFGPTDQGVVFKVDVAGQQAVLYEFSDFGGRTDGAHPLSGLIRDSAGNLYGTTSEGGSAFRGVVFKLDATGSETVLHNFTGPDGECPAAGLTADAAGNFYGTTLQGGSANGGVVFKLDAAGNYTLLHSFQGPDGAAPFGGVIADSTGTLYGTASFGGTANPGTDCCGVVFKIDTAGQLTVLHSFSGGADGGTPTGSLALDSAGNLYGTTLRGGAADAGVVYVIRP
jgi:uncharacterized repeat protein (TIGR03803 family)